jgi:hypothetical protein
VPAFDSAEKAERQGGERIGERRFPRPVRTGERDDEARRADDSTNSSFRLENGAKRNNGWAPPSPRNGPVDSVQIDLGVRVGELVCENDSGLAENGSEESLRFWRVR